MKSSTEAELVGVSDYLPYNIWLLMFIDEQGYGIKYNLVFQENQSTMRMHIKGRNLCTGNSHHTNIRYFFVKDRVDKRELQVEYCPTLLIIAEYFTKPLMGSSFRELWQVIMGHKSIFDLNQNEIIVGRYHSWIINKKSLPDCLEILAEDEKCEIMAIQHKNYPLIGLQFHPESILTPTGKTLLSNFITFVHQFQQRSVLAQN